MASVEMSNLKNPYYSVKRGVGWIDRSDRVRLVVTGADRAKFLHNLTTNEVKRLPVGRGCEAFVTSLQGRTLGYVTLHVADDHILLRTDRGGLESVIPHFQKYGALDDVAWTEVSASTFELHFAGPHVARLLETLNVQPFDETDLSHARNEIGGRNVVIVHESPSGLNGLTIIGEVDDSSQVMAALQSAGEPLGLIALDAGTFEALRIEAGTPVFGRDVTPDNLPQEIGRDARAINFVKGCYLGQETVARLDALGHVNKILGGARLVSSEALPPPPGTALEADGQSVGTVTSAVHSSGWNRPVLLAILRVAQAQAGTELRLRYDGKSEVAVVSELPMPPPPE
jgi:tRNA-modifying protein YgfZ